nr:ubiquitin-related modifier 1 homolog 1-like [Ipomoea batatas]
MPSPVKDALHISSIPERCSSGEKVAKTDEHNRDEHSTAARSSDRSPARFAENKVCRKRRCGRRGGLELLCDSVKTHNVSVEPQDGEQKLTMKYLLSWVRTNLIKERPEMFMKGDTVRPGVLVLVNDTDWELSGQLDTVLEEKDVIVFISTLHGG